MRSKLRTNYPILLALYSILLNSPFINTLWTPTQGWYLEWALYLKNSHIYKDFYVPFGPVNVFLNRFWLIFPDPLIAQRFGDVLVWTLLVIGLYLFISFFTEKKFAFLGSICGTTVFQFSATNTISGYFELSLALVVWGAVFALKSGRIYNFSGGIFFALGILTKQNWLPIYLMILISLMFVKKSNERDRVIAITFGATFLFALFSTYLILNDALVPFIQAMAEGGGKSPNVLRLFRNLVIPISAPEPIFLVISLLSVYKFSDSKISRTKKLALLTLISVLLTTYFGSSTFNDLIKGRGALLVFFLFFLLGSLGMRVANRISAGMLALICVAPAFLLLASHALLVTHPSSFIIFEDLMNLSSQLSTKITALSWPLGITGLVLLLNSNVKLGAKKSSSRYSFKVVILIGLSLSGVLNAFNGGADFLSNLIIGTLGISVIFERILRSHLGQILKPAFALLLLLSSFSISTNVYSWFGWNETLTTHTTKKVQDSILFRNFALTTPQNDFYSAISKGISIARGKIGSQSLSPKIMSFPMQPVVNQLQVLDSYMLNCPILHFDICPDRAAEIDLRNIVSMPPDIVVLFDLGEQFITENEKVWRDGQISTYRKIQDNFLSDKFVQVYEIAPNGINLSTIRILIPSSYFSSTNTVNMKGDDD